MCEMCLKCIFPYDYIKTSTHTKTKPPPGPPKKKKREESWGELGEEQGRFSNSNYSTVINNGSRQNQQELVKKMPSIHGYN